jgi:hypothetical protein
VTGYSVDEGVLGAVADALDRGGVSVGEAGRALGSTPAAGLGTESLDAAAHDLLAGWSARLAEVGAAVDDTAKDVRRCLADYTDTESRIADLFRDSG